MAREGLRYELTSAFQKALRQKGTVTLQGLKVGTNGGEQFVDLTVQTARGTGAAAGVGDDRFYRRGRAAGNESAGPVAGKLRPAAPGWRNWSGNSSRPARSCRPPAKRCRPRRRNSRSTNEELQSTNEELQSTNEELTTSKEEMQSLNEELQTVNTELQAKVDELSRSNNDMKNLLNSTDIATLFLDNDLNVRRFTTQATKIIKLIPGDVGRPITDLASDLRYPELADDAREVLRTLALRGKTDRRARRPLVHRAHHALPHAGRPD